MILNIKYNYKNHFFLTKFLSKKNPESEVLPIRDVKSRIAFLIYFLIAETFGLCCNVLTLIHILKKFEIKIHVFTMIFVDSVLTNIGCVFSIILEILLLSNLVERTRTYCTLVYSSVYVPFSCGAISTFLVALVRYILTKKSARFAYLFF